MSLDAGRVGVRADQVDVHGRVTSPSFLNELLEVLPEWTDMPVWVNGTEEVLPSNTSVPVTSPILADIAYPDIRRDNQYFTYRESPTPVDGLAKIKSIKGNTLVWNQLIQNGNFADASGWTTDTNYGSIAVSNNVLTYTVVQVYNGTWYNRVYRSLAKTIDANHKLLIKMRVDATKNFPLTVLINTTNEQSVNRTIDITPSQKEYSVIVNTTLAGAITFATIFNLSSAYSVGDTIKLGNIQVFDLTKMSLDISNPSEFISLFPLPYYAYNAGTLLSFNGTGIKTTGKNILKLVDRSGTYNGITYSCEDNVITLTGTADEVSFIDFSIDGNLLHLYPSFQYTKGLSPTGTYIGVQTSLRGQNASRDIVGLWTNDAMPVTESNFNADAYYFRVQVNSGVSVDCTLSVQLEIGNEASEFEPCAVHTTTLPISTYFPTGMKSAGTVYDELLPTKAITMIGAVDLGSLTWTKVGAISMFYATYNTDGIFHSGNELPNIKTTMYAVCSATTMYNNRNGIVTDDVITVNAPFLSSAEQRIVIADTSFSDADALKSALSGVYLYYELATPVELPTLSLGD